MVFLHAARKRASEWKRERVRERQKERTRAENTFTEWKTFKTYLRSPGITHCSLALWAVQFFSTWFLITQAAPSLTMCAACALQPPGSILVVSHPPPHVVVNSRRAVMAGLTEKRPGPNRKWCALIWQRGWGRGRRWGLRNWGTNTHTHTHTHST